MHKQNSRAGETGECSKFQLQSSTCKKPVHMAQDNYLTIKTGLLYGTAMGFVVVSIGIIRYKTGMILRDDHTLSYVYWVIFTLSVYYAVFRFKRLHPLSFSYKRTIPIGLFAGMASGLIYTLYIMILNQYFDPGLSSKIIQFKEHINTTGNPDVSANDVADSIKIMQMSEGARGLVYTVVCMTFGVIHSSTATFMAKKLHYKH